MSEQACYNYLSSALNGSFTEVDGPNPHVFWVVLVDGVRVSMNSGKAVWKQRGHALNALVNHIHNMPMGDYHERKRMDWWSHDKKVIKRWIEDHAEVITLDEWKKREGL